MVKLGLAKVKIIQHGRVLKEQVYFLCGILHYSWMHLHSMADSRRAQDQAHQGAQVPCPCPNVEEGQTWFQLQTLHHLTVWYKFWHEVRNKVILSFSLVYTATQRKKNKAPDPYSIFCHITYILMKVFYVIHFTFLRSLINYYNH